MAWFGGRRAEVAELRSQLDALQSRAIGGFPWIENNPAVPFGSGGPAHPSQVQVGVDHALRLAPVYAAARLLADGVASLPLQVYSPDSGGIPKKWTGPSIFNSTSEAGPMGQGPSVAGTVYDWIFQCMTSLVLEGNSFGYIAARDGFEYPTVIEWLAPSDVWIDEAETSGIYNPGRAEYYYKGRHIPKTDMLHVRAFSVAGRTRGISPLRAFASLVSQGEGINAYGRDWFANGGFPPGVMRNTTMEVDEENSAAIKARLVAAIRRRQPLVIGADWEYCADSETEMLTPRGWLRYDQIREGDTALGLNPDTGMSEWQPVTSVHIFDGPHNVTEMSSTTHSSVTTAGHRWPVMKRKTGRTGWTTTATMAMDDRVWRAAPVVAPAEAKWSDALVALVGWYWTEGNDLGAMAEIGQSQSVNPRNVALIRDALTETFGPAVESLRPYLDRPAWRENLRDGMVQFRLNARAAQVITAHAPGKVVSVGFLAQLTRAQLELFITTSIGADGHRRPNGSARITQSSRERLDSFQVACALAGYAGAVREDTRGRWMLEVSPRAWCKPAQPQYVTQRQLDGVVWCPTTPHQNWFARRRGTTYFTGNTPVRVPPNEAQFIESVAMNATQIAAIYGVPPYRIGGTRGDSLTYSNVESEAISFYTDTLRPWLVRLECAFYGILPGRRYCRFNADAMIKTDTKTRHEVYQIDRTIGLRSIDELRRIEDEGPLPSKAGADEMPLLVSSDLARSGKAIPKVFADNIQVLDIPAGVTPGLSGDVTKPTPDPNAAGGNGAGPPKPAGNGSAPAASGNGSAPKAADPAGKPAAPQRPKGAAKPPPARGEVVASITEVAQAWAGGAASDPGRLRACLAETGMEARRHQIAFTSYIAPCMTEGQRDWLLGFMRGRGVPPEGVSASANGHTVSRA